MASPVLPPSALAPYASARKAARAPGVMFRVRHPLLLLDLRIGRKSGAQAEIERSLGVALPGLRASGRCGGGDIMCLGPDQWLVVANSGGEWSEDRRLPGATLCDVSHGRVVVRVSGPRARAMLGKGCMLDLHPREFAPGACAQTSIAKINVIVHRPAEDGAAFDLYAVRSYAGSFWHWLTEAALEYGYGVNP